MNLWTRGQRGRRCKTVGGGDAIFIPLVQSFHLLGADATFLPLMQQQLVLGHLHLSWQTGCPILVSY